MQEPWLLNTFPQLIWISRLFLTMWSKLIPKKFLHL